MKRSKTKKRPAETGNGVKPIEEAEPPASSMGNCVTGFENWLCRGQVDGLAAPLLSADETGVTLGHNHGVNHSKDHGNVGHHQKGRHQRGMQGLLLKLAGMALEHAQPQ